MMVPPLYTNVGRIFGQQMLSLSNAVIVDAGVLTAINGHDRNSSPR